MYCNSDYKMKYCEIYSTVFGKQNFETFIMK